MKSKIAMFNLNRKSTFRSTLPALMLALLLGGAGFLGSPAWAAEIKGFSSEAAKERRAAIRWDDYTDGLEIVSSA